MFQALVRIAGDGVKPDHRIPSHPPSPQISLTSDRDLNPRRETFALVSPVVSLERFKAIRQLEPTDDGLSPPHGPPTAA